MLKLFIPEDTFLQEKLTLSDVYDVTRDLLLSEATTSKWNIRKLLNHWNLVIVK